MKSLTHSIILSEHDRMKYSVTAFGVVKDIVGGKQIVLESAESLTVSDLLRRLEALYPTLLSLNSLLVAVNREYAEAQKTLQPSDEIALIPPVSGG